jgi:hypothetical protein
MIATGCFFTGVIVGFLTGVGGSLSTTSAF